MGGRGKDVLLSLCELPPSSSNLLLSQYTKMCVNGEKVIMSTNLALHTEIPLLNPLATQR